MRLSDPIAILAEACYDASILRFKNIAYQTKDWDALHEWKDAHPGKASAADQFLITKERRPALDDCRVVAMFPQTWGSTALGFSGLGGQAITTEYTVVIECNGEFAVYFGRRFAYIVELPNDLFFDHMANRTIAPCKDQSIYTK
jgi:hypothetical protein